MITYRSAGAEDLKLLACYRHIAPLERKRENLLMIQNNQELEATLNRIERFQKQVEKLQEVETNSHNYKLSAGGFLAEIDRMDLEVTEYLSTRPSELIDKADC